MKKSIKETPLCEYTQEDLDRSRIAFLRNCAERIGRDITELAYRDNGLWYSTPDGKKIVRERR